MDSYNLSFAEIAILRTDIAEVIINEGIEMNVAMVKEYHDFLLAHLNTPFALLINKINAYSYNFEAQLELATLNEINAMAVVTYNKNASATTHYLSTLPRKVKWNMSQFTNRTEALDWLEQEQNNT
jgi:hypothetical protein